jgi:hypothetical protein
VINWFLSAFNWSAATAQQYVDLAWEQTWFLVNQSFLFVRQRFEDLGVDTDFLPDVEMVEEVRTWVEVVNDWVPLDTVLACIPPYIIFRGGLVTMRIAAKVLGRG